MPDTLAIYIQKLKDCCGEFFGEFAEVAVNTSCATILKMPDEELRRKIKAQIEELKESEAVLSKGKVPEPPMEVQTFLDGGPRPKLTD